MSNRIERDDDETSTSKAKKIGLLIVGIGGNNGTCLVAGHMANQRGLSWESSIAGRVHAPNWNGCITQLEPRGGGVGFRGRYPLSDFADAAVGGWDIRPTPLGDALYENRVLEYDLVRQVRDDMNRMTIMRGVYDPSFLGESQHGTATHVVEDAPTFHEKVERLREDIRAFKREHSVDGHITVIWSASVERPSEVSDGFRHADDMLRIVLENRMEEEEEEEDGCDLSPSIMYAIAAGLEGCSFVNGGSQNTMSDAMCELFEASYRRGGKESSSSSSSSSSSVLSRFANLSTEIAYMLGTDFKAGQTKFKTSAVEYIRALGLKPRVIASSNHLGNNDMLNLTSKKTVRAKMRVKKNIFGPWEEDDLDHQVAVMYTKYMLDEKRDVVEYTSLGFLDSPHTMLTYTRCMDSILCVPLMIDAAVWCDYFARRGAPSSRVAKATAYLFKIPEGGAKGVDPGFARQMQALETALRETSSSSSVDDDVVESILKRGVSDGIITMEQAESLKRLSS